MGVGKASFAGTETIHAAKRCVRAANTRVNEGARK
jgi:hypothetical protein